MANVTNNALFVASALLFVVGLLFLAYPYLTLAAITLGALGYASYVNSSTLLEFYSHISSSLWPPVTVIDHLVSAPYSPNLLSGVDLPSPIPHLNSGIETVKNRRSSVDEIVSSTPRGTPTSGHGPANPSSMQLQMRSSSECAATDSRQLNFGRISTPKTSRFQAQGTYQNNVETNSNQKLRHRSNNTKVQNAAGPLLSSARYNPAFDAGIFVNVNSPGFTDRLVRCANDNTGMNWGYSGSSSRQEKYGSVGLFPVVHLNSPSLPSLSPKNSQKAPNSSVRVRIAAPVYSEQNPRLPLNRGSNMQMRSYSPMRETIRRNEVAKSVLESLQEASRKRIYSQCQEVLEEDPGKKRQRKGDSALPNPNCDMYQYRHIRAPPIPSGLPVNVQNEANSQTKRAHDDPSKANEPKRQRQLGRPTSTNNEISSSLSSSKTLLQQLSGNKRKADNECSIGGREKQFKDASNSDPAPSTSRWLQSHSCDEGKSAARTQEVVRSLSKPCLDSNQVVANVTVKKKHVATETSDYGAQPSTSAEGQKTVLEVHNKEASDLTSKLFRKDIVSRSQPKANLPEKKGSSWAQEPPDADERCLLEQSNSSEIDRPERFQSLLSRMCGEDVHPSKTVEGIRVQTATEPSKSSSALFPSDPVKSSQSSATISTNPSSSTGINVAVSLEKSSTPNSETMPLVVSKSELITKFQSTSVVQPTISTPPPPASLPAPTSSSSSQVPSFASILPLETGVSKEVATVTFSQAKTDAPTVVPPSTLSVSSALSTKPMFNFSPPSSTVAPQPVVPQSLPSMTVSASSASATSSTSFTPSIFKFSVPPVTANSETSDPQPPPGSLLTVPSKPLATPPQTIGFPFSSIQPHTPPTIFSVGGAKGSASSLESVKFSLPNEKPQFSMSSGTFVTQPEPQANGPPNLTTSASSLGTGSNQTQAPLSSGQKSAFGGFQFSGSSASMFGQSSTNGLPTVPSFSFAPSSTTVTNSSLEKSATDSKSASASGSITFGTVSSAALRQSPTFNFSHPSGNPSTNDTQKSPFQLGTTFSAANSNSDSSSNASSAFRNPAQGLFNGFNSITNPVTSAAQSSPQQNQQPGTGIFSFGSSQNQQPSNVAFGVQTSTSPAMFAEGASQQSSFGATTTTGFSPHNNVPSFSTSMFGSSTSLGSLPFGSSQPPAVPFGGPVPSNNTPAFGLSSGNPPSFSSSTIPSTAPSFGSTSASSFGVTAEPTFGSSTSSAPAANIANAFSFGASSDKPAVPSFSFGANSTSQAPAFSFGSSEQQHQTNGSSPFQFGQATSPGAPPAFQFASPSPQPGSGGFSMGSGPSTPQRSRTLQTRRRRI